jgi:hypothetical protein
MDEDGSLVPVPILVSPPRYNVYESREVNQKQGTRRPSMEDNVFKMLSICINSIHSLISLFLYVICIFFRYVRIELVFLVLWILTYENY